jgi:hypothetical protein
LKNTHNLRFKFPEFERHHNPTGMQNQVEPMRQQLHMSPQNLAHAPLDAVALNRFAEDTPRGQAHSRTKDTVNA